MFKLNFSSVHQVYTDISKWRDLCPCSDNWHCRRNLPSCGPVTVLRLQVLAFFYVSFVHLSKGSVCSEPLVRCVLDMPSRVLVGLVCFAFFFIFFFSPSSTSIYHLYLSLCSRSLCLPLSSTFPCTYVIHTFRYCRTRRF